MKQNKLTKIVEEFYSFILFKEVIFNYISLCILSLTLFNVFLEFVLDEVKSLSNDLTFGDQLSINIICYADNTTLLALIFQNIFNNVVAKETLNFHVVPFIP